MTLSQGTAPKNRHSTEYDFGPQFSQPPAGVTGAAPTGRRHGAGPPRRSAETVERPPLPVQEQGISFRGAGSFCTRTGSFCPRTGKFLRDSGHVSIRSTISFRRLLANSSDPTPPGMRQLLRQRRLMNIHPAFAVRRKSAGASKAPGPARRRITKGSAGSSGMNRAEASQSTRGPSPPPPRLSWALRAWGPLGC